MNKIINKLKTAKDYFVLKTATGASAVKAKLEERRGSVSEMAIVIIIGVVLGGILLIALSGLFNNTIVPGTESKVESMFGMS